jgi:hypothetical protein
MLSTIAMGWMGNVVPRPNYSARFEQRGVYNYMGDSIFQCRYMHSQHDTDYYSFVYHDFKGVHSLSYLWFTATQHFPDGELRVAQNGEVFLQGNIISWKSTMFMDEDSSFVFWKIHDPRIKIGDSIANYYGEPVECNRFFIKAEEQLSIDNDTLYHYRVKLTEDIVYGYLFSEQTGFNAVYQYNLVDGIPEFAGDRRLAAYLHLQNADSMRVY